MRLLLALSCWFLSVIASVAQERTGSERSVGLPTGVELHWEESGDPTGEVMLFLHGYTDSRLSFRPTIQALLARRPDLRVVALDFRGHGRSSLPPAAECAAAPERCFRVEDLARDVVAFLDALAIERVHIVGHSYGSLVAQDVALAAPERVASIVLLGSLARAAGNPVIEGFVLGELVEGRWRPLFEAGGRSWPVDAYAIPPIEIDAGIEEWLLANWVTEIAADPSYLREMAARTARVPIGTWLGVGRAALGFDNVARLARLRVPALVLWAIQDVVATETDQIALRSALDAAARACRATSVWKRYGREPLPASGLAESDLGHNFPWGAGEQVAADIAAWLERGDPTPDLHFVDLARGPVVATDVGAAEVIRSRPCP